MWHVPIDIIKVSIDTSQLPISIVEVQIGTFSRFVQISFFFLHILDFFPCFSKLETAPGCILELYSW